MSDLVRYEAGAVTFDVARFEQWLATCESVDALTEAKARVEAATAYARHRKLKPMVFDGLELKLKCERRIGEVVPTLGIGRGIKSTTLADFDLTDKQSSRWQRLASVPAEDFERYLAESRIHEEEPTTAGVLRLLENGKGAHVANNSGDNEWYTPKEYIDAARSVMGGIELDPASTAEANQVVGAEKFYDCDADGLREKWNGRVWMNPPYARPLIDHFCGKVAESYSDGAVTQACVLVNNATETGWFHALAEVASALCFPRHRVKFWHPDKDGAAPLQGQAVVYLGPHVDRFRSEFVRFGFTVTL